MKKIFLKNLHRLPIQIISKVKGGKKIKRRENLKMQLSLFVNKLKGEHNFKSQSKVLLQFQTRSYVHGLKLLKQQLAGVRNPDRRY